VGSYSNSRNTYTLLSTIPSFRDFTNNPVTTDPKGETLEIEI
jgi:hypothetical protein